LVEEPLEVAGSLGVLATRGDHSNYHFLLDVLPRLAIMETPGVPAPERWYVPLQRGFQREILELAGFPPDADLIDSDLAPHVRAETLIVPGLPDAHLRTPPWAVDFIRERLRPPDLERVPGRRIYVTRGRERHNRIVTNEEELVDILGDRGFTVVDPGAMPIAEQIRTFAEAEWIVAPHGAALANLAFASPGASAIELFPPDYVQLCYWKLADCVPGLGYRYLVGAGRAPRGGRMNGVMSDITVDLAALVRALDALPVELAPAAAKAHR
jgi:capsular polysaccharide biosynthesis protein